MRGRHGLTQCIARPAPSADGCGRAAVREYDLYRYELLKEKYEHEQSERCERRER